MNTENNDAVLDENALIHIRRKKLEELRKHGQAFPNDAKREHYAADILEKYRNLGDATVTVAIAGRMVLRRQMGKASFMHVQDMTGRLQVYLKQDELGETYEAFKHWDLGDIVSVTGFLFVTKTGELTVHAQSVRLLTKSLRPLPDKFHGLQDQELCYRRRYVDLIMNEKTREVFRVRSAVIAFLREFLTERRFMEVETPMMHPIAEGLQHGLLEHIITL